MSRLTRDRLMTYLRELYAYFHHVDQQTDTSNVEWNLSSVWYVSYLQALIHNKVKTAALPTVL